MPCDARGAQVGEGHRGGVENGVAGWCNARLWPASATLLPIPSSVSDIRSLSSHLSCFLLLTCSRRSRTYINPRMMYGSILEPALLYTVLSCSLS
jgi:hypothetical protein